MTMIFLPREWDQHLELRIARYESTLESFTRVPKIVIMIKKKIIQEKRVKRQRQEFLSAGGAALRVFLIEVVVWKHLYPDVKAWGPRTGNTPPRWICCVRSHRVLCFIYLVFVDDKHCSKNDFILRRLDADTVTYDKTLQPT